MLLEKVKLLDSKMTDYIRSHLESASKLRTENEPEEAKARMLRPNIKIQEEEINEVERSDEENSSGLNIEFEDEGQEIENREYQYDELSPEDLKFENRGNQRKPASNKLEEPEKIDVYGYNTSFIYFDIKLEK